MSVVGRKVAINQSLEYSTKPYILTEKSRGVSRSNYFFEDTRNWAKELAEFVLVRTYVSIQVSINPITVYTPRSPQTRFSQLA